MNVTPDWITHIKSGEIFTFGSNLSGRHGLGAAKMAMQWGAVYGTAEGLAGSTYALPTVNASITAPLGIDEIKKHVDNFVETVKACPHLKFLVTEVGCGLAGCTVKEIAPLFEEASALPNVYLPQRFWDTLWQ